MLPNKETLTIEFKSDLKKYPNSEIFEVIVGLANTEGGDLYLGIEDSGEVTGVHDEHKNPITLSAFVANNTVPPVPVRAEIIEDKFPVLKISVPKISSGIVATASGKVLHRRVKANGEPETVVMYPAEYATRMSDLRLLDYSALPLIQATTEDFDLREVDRLRQVILSYGGDKTLLELTNDDLYKAMGFVREQGDKLYPTVTGILFIGKVDAIKTYVPTSSSVFQVLDGTEVRVNEDIVLPLLATIEKLNTYLLAYNPEEEIEIGIYRTSVPNFDKRAIREAIVNAFSHRDYTKMGRVRVAINDEGMIISNPGGFVEGVSINNLLSAEPHGRNPLLADALKRVGLAERTGRGIDRIYEGSLVFGKPMPDYSASTSATVSLFIPKSKPDKQLSKLIAYEQKRLGRPLSLNMLLILNTLKDLPKSTMDQLSETTNLSQIIIKNILDSSIEAGLVETFGSGRNKTYTLSAKAYDAKKKETENERQLDIDESRYPELIINMAKTSDFISRADVINLLNIDEDKAYKLLKKLTIDGILEPINKGRYAKYKLKEI